MCPAFIGDALSHETVSRKVQELDRELERVALH
jgi:hypothetical protein